MAFQQQGGMGNGGQGGPGEHHGPQGTEYTLQGVMRFLQIEWHNHERARNSWDIERAEMKAKIAKQEGECRHAKRINEQLDRQVRMLEMALKNERAKSKKAANGQAAEAEADKEGGEMKGGRRKGAGEEVNGEVKESKPGEERRRPRAQALVDMCSVHVDIVLTLGVALSSLPHNSFLATADPQDQSEKEREQYLDNTTKYLKNCMKEIQYLLTPPQHPPPPQLLPNGNYTGLPEPPLSVEDIYARHQQQRNQRQPGQALPQPSAMPNHQPPPVPNSLPQTSLGQQQVQTGYRDYAPDVSNQPPSESLQQAAQHNQASYEDQNQVEAVTHTYDARGRAVQEELPQPLRQIRQPADADGWTFDDEQPPLQTDNSPSDLPGAQPRRPDTDLFPSAANNNTHMSAKSPSRSGPGSHRRKSSGSQAMARRRSSQGKSGTSTGESHADEAGTMTSQDPTQFRVKFALRGHLDVVRSVIFSGGGSPGEPEVCTAGDDGTIKRWILPASYQQNFGGGNPSSSSSQPSGMPPPPTDLDIPAYFTHRGHDGIVTSLAACPASTGFSTGGRANGDGWIFSGGQDATVRVWERGRVDPKATLEGHTDAVWAVCVLPATVGAVFGSSSSGGNGQGSTTPSAIANFGGPPDRLLLVSGSADGTVKVWAVSAPPLTSSAGTGSRRGVGGARRHSVTSGSNFPSSPQPSVASSTTFSYTLIHTIARPARDEDGNGDGDGNGSSGTPVASPTCITPLGASGETFVVSYTDSTILIFDTRTGEEVIGMAANETYDGTMGTSINTVVATSLGLEGTGTSAVDAARGMEAEEVGAGATGGREGVEGVVISGHEDRFVRFFDGNSGQCTYTMLAHPSAISSLALSKDGREAVSAGHDASIRFWSLEKRICTQDVVSHRAMRGEGVCAVAWSGDGRLVVSAGGDGVGKVFVR
ncbi:hypothetical protein LTR36_009909 [Oleoguttula mirabilis]|uniref:Striatin N-terminal domain-containing protein n=1 Tax=Oleoguttula mirabilis TaxID=1507867 RepID=A0AAV9J5U3_9PEZI|nr:hypothetical protein LTR36_009909 [Oleoguttula mirabilis]